MPEPVSRRPRQAPDFHVVVPKIFELVRLEAANEELEVGLVEDFEGVDGEEGLEAGEEGFDLRPYPVDEPPSDEEVEVFGLVKPRDSLPFRKLPFYSADNFSNEQKILEHKFEDVF